MTVTTNITLQKKNGETLHMNGRSGRVVFIFTNYDGETVYLIEIDDFIEIFLTEHLELKEAAPQPETPAPTISIDEHLKEVSMLNEKIGTLNSQNFKEHMETDKVKKDAKELAHKSIACLDAVTAMLDNSQNGTHRMRNFYAESMIKFIGNIKSQLQSYLDPEPF